MVIGNNKLHSKLIDALGLGNGGNSVIHRYDKLHRVRRKRFHGSDIKTVALGLPVGNIADNVRAEHFKIEI